MIELGEMGHLCNMDKLTFFCLSWTLHVTSLSAATTKHLYTHAPTHTPREMAINQPNSETFERRSVGKTELKGQKRTHSCLQSHSTS